MNLLLDVATRARLGVPSFGREGALSKLGLDRDYFQTRQDESLGPLLANLREGQPANEVLESLRLAIKALGARRPNRLSAVKESAVEAQLGRLAARLAHPTVIPGLTVFQAKGREWGRVGVVLSQSQVATLAAGLQELEEEDCIIYVALTRARRACGRLADHGHVAEIEELSLEL
jgi:DNA helicase-2/ATP-dependent DNA helicase PcrA